MTNRISYEMIISWIKKKDALSEKSSNTMPGGETIHNRSKTSIGLNTNNTNISNNSSNNSRKEINLQNTFTTK